MRSLLRFSWRALALSLWVLLGLVILGLLFPLWTQARRQTVHAWWSKWLLVWCGVQVDYMGQPELHQPILFVINHVSWLDIFVVNQKRATSFIAKSDIRSWPFVGWLVTGAGTLYIERGQRHAIKHVAAQMQQRFAQQQAVGLFPEGTTSDGFTVRPFHASLFEAALRTQVDIQPVALRFFDGNHRSDRVAFVGEQSLWRNGWLLLSQPGVRIECVFLPPLRHTQNQAQGRAATAQQAYDLLLAQVEKGLNAPSRFST